MSQFGFLTFLDAGMISGVEKNPLGFVTCSGGDDVGRVTEVQREIFAIYHSMLKPPLGKAVTVNAVAAVIRDLAEREGLMVPQFLSRHKPQTVEDFFSFTARLQQELF